MRSSIPLPRWPIIGRSISWRMLGRTSVGPGKKKRPNPRSLLAEEGLAATPALGFAVIESD
jgi:hypothetical protein